MRRRAAPALFACLVGCARAASDGRAPWWETASDATLTKALFIRGVDQCTGCPTAKLRKLAAEDKARDEAEGKIQAAKDKPVREKIRVTRRSARAKAADAMDED